MKLLSKVYYEKLQDKKYQLLNKDILFKIYSKF